MTAESLFLCLDQGGHASRAAIFDAGGNLHALAYREIATRRNGDQVEHDPQALLVSLREAAASAITELGAAAGRVTAAGLATQRSSIVCWDRDNGMPLSPVLSWQDRRAAAWLEPYAAHEQRVHQLTGLRLSPHYGVSKLRWCLDQLPEVAQAFAEHRLQFGPLASWLARSLCQTAEACADPANASRTLLWDRHELDWSQELLTLFGIPPDCLPRSVPSVYSWGELEVAGRQVPLTVVTGDQSAALFAFGQPAAESLFINIGTGAFVQRAVTDSAPAPGALLASVVFQDQDAALAVIEGTVNGAGSAVAKVAADLQLEQEYVEAHAAEWLSAGGGPLFVNGIAGLGSPWWLPHLESRFAGDGSAEQKIAAVLESVAFLLVTNIDACRRLTGPSDQIIATGGLAQVEPLLQMLADLAGLRVEHAEITEATARGLAYLVAGRPADWPAQRAAQEFEPHANAALSARYADWLALMPPLPVTD